VLRRRFDTCGQLTATYMRGSNWQVHVEQTSFTKATSSFPDPQRIHGTPFSELDLADAHTSSLFIPSASLDGRWSLPVPAAWSRAILLFSAQPTKSPRKASSPKSVAWEQWPGRLQERNTVPVSFAGLTNICA